MAATPPTLCCPPAAPRAGARGEGRAHPRRATEESERAAAFDSDHSLREGSQSFTAPDAPSELERFGRLYDDHVDFVWRSARQLRVPESALDDVCQEVFINVFRQIAGFRGDASLKTWIFGILRNVVSNHHRSRRRRPADNAQRGADALGELAQLPDRPDTNPEHRLTLQQEAALAQRVLDGLPEELRLVLWLTDVEELSVPEVAEALAWNVNTTYTRLRTARRDFARALSAIRSNTANGGAHGAR